MLRLLLVLSLTSCAVVEDLDEDDGFAETESEVGSTSIWYTQITKEYFLPSAKVATETNKLFKSEAAWQAYFGANHPSPGIDFTKNWAIFYTPGTQRVDLKTTQGWRSRIAKVTLSSTGKTLSITTKLEFNGDCAPRTARPFVTVTIPIPAANPTYKRFYHYDTTRSCD